MNSKRKQNKQGFRPKTRAFDQKPRFTSIENAAEAGVNVAGAWQFLVYSRRHDLLSTLDSEEEEQQQVKKVLGYFETKSSKNADTRKREFLDVLCVLVGGDEAAARQLPGELKHLFEPIKGKLECNFFYLRVYLQHLKLDQALNVIRREMSRLCDTMFLADRGSGMSRQSLATLMIYAHLLTGSTSCSGKIFPEWWLGATDIMFNPYRLKNDVGRLLICLELCTTWKAAAEGISHMDRPQEDQLRIVILAPVNARFEKNDLVIKSIGATGEKDLVLGCQMKDDKSNKAAMKVTRILEQTESPVYDVVEGDDLVSFLGAAQHLSPKNVHDVESAYLEAVKASEDKKPSA